MPLPNIIRILLLLAAFYFFPHLAYANYYQGDDFDPSFDSSYSNFEREFPADPDTVARPVVKKHLKAKKMAQRRNESESFDYDLPHQIQTNEKVVIVDPIIHAWGAYDSNGMLLRAGRASAGAKWCPDIGRGCKTKSGMFRIYSLGDEGCISSKYPINEGGGAPMPYCMYFNGSQGLHGSNQVVDGNVSHGCVRMRPGDAEWLRYNFATVGTKVIVKPY